MNNIEQIESNLNLLEKKGQLYSKESIELIENWVISKSTETIGISEEITAENLEKDYGYYKVFGNSSDKNIDVLFIVLHGGLLLPHQFHNFFGFTRWKSIAQSILQNHDVGIRWLTNQFIQNLKTSEYKYKIIFYNYSRIGTDVNRLFVEDQIVDSPYRGEGLWSSSTNKTEISSIMVDPFFSRVEEIIKSTNPKFIVHPHTYDTFGGGKASSGHEIDSQNKRPASMIFNYYNQYRGRAFGKYHPEKNARFYFLNNEKNIEKVINIQKAFLSKIPNLEEEVEVTVDYPYVSPPQLPGLLRTYTKAPQLIVENRKDLFEHGHNQIFQSLDSICKEFIDSV